MAQVELKSASEKLKMLFECFGVTNSEVASQCGVSRSLISKIVNCRIVPTISAMTEICLALTKIAHQKHIDSRFIWG